MITVSEKEWKDIPERDKRVTPLTGLRQYLWSNPEDRAERMWITESINFIISDKEGSRYADNTND